jgi:alkylhydroperoxidase family enzyme
VADLSEARVPLLSVADAVRAAKEVGISERLAELNVFRALLHHPQLAASVSGLLGTLLFEGNVLAPRLRELLILRIAWVTGSGYEWSQHWRVALQLEIPERDAAAVREWVRSDCFDASDRAILKATDEVLAEGAISEETWAECQAQLESSAEQVELVLAICNWRMFSILLRSLAIPLDEGLPEWPPDGRLPFSLVTEEEA